MQADRYWFNLAANLKDTPNFQSVYVTGACNAGKTTLCRYLVDELSTFSVGYLDCDPGQSQIGPPGTVGLKVLSKRGDSQREMYLRFIGTTSPASNVLQSLASIKRLQEKAVECKVQRLIVDSSGFVQGSFAREFQYQVIDLIRPDTVVVLMNESAVNPLFRNFLGTPQIEILRFPISESAVSRTPPARKAYRRESFSHYFKTAETREFPFKHIGFHGKIPRFQKPETWKNLLIALCESENFVLRLGIIEHIDLENNSIRLLAPPFDQQAVCSIEFGDLYLDRTGEELPHPKR
jgi:polynucleotide 5'-hydroxyl-kinase GRC3/NOL9